MSMETIIENLKQQARESWSGDTGERRAEVLEAFIRAMLADYADKLELPQEAILEAIEGRRNYSAINYYQQCNFPSLKDVTVYDTQGDLKAAVGEMKFRCPCCHEISTDPYTCNSGAKIPRTDQICDWKSWGLFGAMGKGFHFTIKEKFLDNPVVDEIFMPVAFENQEG